MRAEKVQTPLARLCRYYLGCLTHDIDTGPSVFAESKYGDPDYIELNGLPHVQETWASASQVAGLQRLQNRVARDRGRKTLYIGYPVRIRLHRARSGWKGHMVEPLLLFPARDDLGDSSTVEFEETPVLNFAHLRNSPTAYSGNLIEEAIQLADELGLSGPPNQIPELDELFLRLPTSRPEWDWMENPDVYQLSSGLPLSQIQCAGIYNRAIICIADRSPYTRGLESELARLQETPEDKYSGTALGAWLSGQTESGEERDTPPLLQAVPLNLEQRTAIEQSFSNSLTVITGPPGTGKSQVVTALLMNAAWRGLKVLFASKNNKAVDVVEERVNTLGPRPMLLRLGTAEHRGKVAEYLSSLRGAGSTADDETTYQYHLERHRHLLQEMESQQRLLDDLVAARNRVDRTEQGVEDLRGIFGEDRFQQIRHLPFTEIVEAPLDLSEAVDGADRRHQSLFHKLAWPLIKKGRYERLREVSGRFQDTSNALGIHGPIQPPNDGTFLQWADFRDSALARCRLAQRVVEYFSALTTLQECEPAEEVAKSVLKLNAAIADNSMNLWQSWLRLQPNRLSQEGRRLLGDYSALLLLIVNANQTNTRVERSVLRRYYQLSEKVGDLLPCWAITSLSARGLPLEPGIFDLVVIDEASQCDIASALPLLYRAKHAVILGDPNQLRHITSINTRVDQQLLTAESLEMDHPAWVYSTSSLFDLASGLCRGEDLVALRDHHRSHADIIRFANDQFYESRLRIATDYSTLKALSGDGPAIRWVDLKGRVERLQGRSAVNEEEALAVVRELRIMLEQGYHGTIGVVSPFRAHVNRIRELVFQDGELTQRLIEADFIADTVHRFQGDERDLIIFSPAVSEGISEGALNFLRRNGNLFNVAITRARSTLVVVGDKSAASSSGVDYLEAFARYVDSIAKSGPRRAPSNEFQGSGIEYPTVARPEQVSDWERIFYKALFSAGHRPIPQYSVDQYDLDFALFCRSARLNIEVDGELYHRDWNGELCRRDQIRNQRLMEIGWDVMRFWVYEIRDDLDNCVSRVSAWVTSHS